MPHGAERYDGVGERVHVMLPYTYGVVGGGVVQAECTRRSLLQQGWEAKFYSHSVPIEEGDIVHFFGACSEFKRPVSVASSLGANVVVTSIMSSVRPAWHYRLWGLLDRALPVMTEYGMKRAVLDGADAVVACSESERRWVEAAFGLDRKRIECIPIGLEVDRFVTATGDVFSEKYGLRDFVLQVSRIAPSKGQLRLIEAMETVQRDTVFIGPDDGTNPNYVERFRTAVGRRDWLHYLGAVDYDSELLASAYKAARVHVLPSRREVPGMVNLEAAAADTAVVAGPYPSLKEYMGDYVFYCDPLDVKSIRESVVRALQEGARSGQAKVIREKHSWESVALSLGELYLSLRGK